MGGSDELLRRNRRIRIFTRYGRDDVLIVHRFDVRPDERGYLLDRGEAEPLMRAWSTREARNEGVRLSEIVMALDAHPGWGSRAPSRRDYESWIVPALEDAIARGELVALRCEMPVGAAAPESPVGRVQTKQPKSKKTAWFSLTVLDEVGRAVPGVKIAFDVAGDSLVVPTNGAGVARLDDLEGMTTVGATLESVAQAQRVLAPRWQDPRAPSVPKGDRVFVRQIREATDTLSLPSEAPTTLVLTPHLECREIPGSHFEFGRSFVRSDALELLAGVAEALAGDETLKAMIFGHTDRAGSEALNKELSERRAKALHALLTQDSGAWEELFSGTADGPSWKEKWDVEEVQHMLNALGVTDDDGNALDEDGARGARTIQAIHRFQSGDYPDCPAEQAPLPSSTTLGAAGRKELFLAYAKRISRKPVDPGCFVPIGGSPFMGCGEYNPLSVSVTDAESRRAVVFLLDPAAGPPDAPCQLGSTKPCLSNCGPAPTEPGADGKPPYRCKVYQSVASKCPCQAGADLSHDLVVRIPYALEDADDLPHVFKLTSDDGTITQTRSLSSDCRDNDSHRAEFVFNHLPENHAYTLECNDGQSAYRLFEEVPYDDLPVALGGDVQDLAALDPPDEPEELLASNDDAGSSAADVEGLA